MVSFLEPKNLRQAFSPIICLNWLVGISVYMPTSSPRSIVIMTIYTVILWAFLLFTFYIGVNSMVAIFYYDSSPMAVLMYTALIYTNAISAMGVPVLALMRKKKVLDCFESLARLEEPYYQALSKEKDYRRLLKPQLYTIATIIALIIAITTIDSLWFRSNTSIFTILALVITLHHPTLLLLVTDLTFCLSIGLASNNMVANTISKRRTFKAIRKLHFEVTKIAVKFNHAYGVQNLISMGLSFVMITGLLYTIYVALHSQVSASLLIEEIVPPTGWCVVYAYKIFMISHTCASVRNEAYKSGQIIYDILGTTADRELQKEVQEFSLQLIQNPVQFTACGFFALDHTYIQGAIGSITTYLVILIQMSDASCKSDESVSTVSGNQTSPSTI